MIDDKLIRIARLRARVDEARDAHEREERAASRWRLTARRMASEARRYRRLADQRAARHARVLDGLRDILGALPGETLADAVGRMIRERDALAARVAEFEEGIRSLRDSYDLTTGSDSPLPDLARDVVRGFFVGAETDHREPAYCRRCGYDHA